MRRLDPIPLIRSYTQVSKQACTHPFHGEMLDEGCGFVVAGPSQGKLAHQSTDRHPTQPPEVSVTFSSVVTVSGVCARHITTRCRTITPPVKNSIAGGLFTDNTTTAFSHSRKSTTTSPQVFFHQPALSCGNNQHLTNPADSTEHPPPPQIITFTQPIPLHAFRNSKRASSPFFSR